MYINVVSLVSKYLSRRLGSTGSVKYEARLYTDDNWFHSRCLRSSQQPQQRSSSQPAQTAARMHVSRSINDSVGSCLHTYRQCFTY